MFVRWSHGWAEQHDDRQHGLHNLRGHWQPDCRQLYHQCNGSGHDICKSDFRVPLRHSTFRLCDGQWNRRLSQHDKLANHATFPRRSDQAQRYRLDFRARWYRCRFRLALKPKISEELVGWTPCFEDTSIRDRRCPDIGSRLRSMAHVRLLRYLNCISIEENFYTASHLLGKVNWNCKWNYDRVGT